MHCTEWLLLLERDHAARTQHKTISPRRTICCLLNTDIYKPLSTNVRYLLPEGIFFFRVLRSTSIGAERFAYPSELTFGSCISTIL